MLSPIFHMNLLPGNIEIAFPLGIFAGPESESQTWHLIRLEIESNFLCKGLFI